MRLLPAFIIAPALLVAAMNGPAQAEDLHRLWDRQCGGCHGHAGSFARSSLAVVNGTLVGRLKGDQVRLYLETHNGGYSPETIAGMLTMLYAQVQTPSIFRESCVECHGTAAQFVRESLISRDGRLEGRHSGTSVAETLSRHGGLNGDEAALLLDALTRVEREVHGP